MRLPSIARRTICWIAVLAWMTAGAVSGAAAAAPLEVVHAVYRADRPFPEFIPLWHESWRIKKEGNKETPYFKEMPLGGYIHLFVRNSGSQPVTITDVRLEGIGLTEAVRLSKDEKAGIHPASVRIAKIPREQIDRLLELGEPVWFKAEPENLAPGTVADITVRLRRSPPVEVIRAQVVCGAGAVPAAVPVSRVQPDLAGVSFVLDFSEVITYVRTPGRGGPAPVRFSIDGQDVTAQSTILTDPELDTAVIVTRLATPVERGSFHYLQADLEDGSRAAAGLRAVADEFRYGMWGYINKGNTPQERAESFLKDMEDHNVNVLMYSISKDVSEYMLSEAGAAYAERTGLRMMATWPGNARKPVYYFLLDEPDAQDYAVSMLDSGARLGSLAQGLVARSRQIRSRDPVPPILLNIDNTYKPENWYMYAQLPDVMCADPYYSGELASALSSRRYVLKYHEKPTYVYGVATICRWACAPKPLHIILNCVRDDNKQHPFRFSTPSEKRIEVFYAVAAGATSLSYWWYTPYDECYGVGGDDVRGRALWREMGVLGAEVRTAGPVLTRSCPAFLPVDASPGLWVRTLLGGPDTVAVLVVNDTSRGSRTGTTIRPVTPAAVRVRVPGWLGNVSAFEIDSAGVRDVPCAMAGAEANLELKRVNVTRLVILTADAGLKTRLEKLYTERFAPAVRRLKARR